MKKSLNFIIAASILTGSVSAAAYGDDISVELNGTQIYFDQPPIIQDGRTLVPMRAIFEAMGCDVNWNGELQQIVVWRNGELLMNLGIGRTTMDLFDLGTRFLDVPPRIINGRTLVPLRAVSESMGAEVEWNENTRNVSITYIPTSEDDFTDDSEEEDDEYYDTDTDYNDTDYGDNSFSDESESDNVEEIIGNDDVVEF